MSDNEACHGYQGVKGGHCRGCELRWIAESRSALATSQADVTRLAVELAELRNANASLAAEIEDEDLALAKVTAELAESVRALAVSQGEVATLKREVSRAYFNGSDDAVKHHFADGGCKHAIAAAAEKTRGDLERARELLREARRYVANMHGVPSGLNGQAIAFLVGLDAFLAPPTPTATPSPTGTPK